MALEVILSKTTEELLGEKDPEKLHQWATEIARGAAKLMSKEDADVSSLFALAAFFEARAVYLTITIMPEDLLEGPGQPRWHRYFNI